MPLVRSHQSTHSQDTPSPSGVASASSGNYLRTMFISHGWQKLQQDGLAEGPISFTSKTNLLGTVPTPEVFRLSLNVQVFTHRVNYDISIDVHGINEPRYHFHSASTLEAVYQPFWAIRGLDSSETWPLVVTLLHDSRGPEAEQKHWWALFTLRL